MQTKIFESDTKMTSASEFAREKGIYKWLNDPIKPDSMLMQSVLTELRENTVTDIGSVTLKWSMNALRACAVLGAFCLTILLTMPVAAAHFPSVYRLMYQISPEVAQFFLPVQEADESDGIRMEVVSTYIHEDTVEVYLTLQDLTGDRLDGTTDLYDSYFIHTPFDCSSTCELLEYEEATKTATFLICITQWGDQEIVGDKITFGIRGFVSHKTEYEALSIPIDLEEAAMETSAQTMYTSLTGWGRGNPDYDYSKEKHDHWNTKVLQPGEPDERFPLSAIDLTGIAYVDGALHIQLAVEDALWNDNHGHFFLRDAEGNDRRYDYSLNFCTRPGEMEQNGFLSWFVASEEKRGRVDYTECVFEIAPEELSQYSLYGYFVTSDTFEEGYWEVTFPIEQTE